MMGPVQVLVVGFDRPSFSGEVLAEFTRLREAGIVRLVDLLLVSRREDGTLETLAAPAGLDAGLGGVAAALLGRPADGAGGRAGAEADGGTGPDADGGTGPEADGGIGAEADVSAWSLADAVPAGSAAAVALIEHIWAGPLNAAIQRAGGKPLEETWLAPDDLEVLAALVDQRGLDQRGLDHQGGEALLSRNEDGS